MQTEEHVANLSQKIDENESRSAPPSQGTAEQELLGLFGLDRFTGSDEKATMFKVDTPAGWECHRAQPWAYLKLQSSSLPDQGWKIHVSSVEASAYQVLSIVSRIAFERGISFKHLVDVGQLRSSNSKYADRASAGKFIALYPVSEEELEVVLRELDSRLQGMSGPYVLSDVQFGKAPVYVRYGAYSEMWTITEDGVQVLALRDDSGELVEDMRQPEFHVPPFVSVPRFLSEIVRERLQPTDGTLSALLEGYKFERVLHFNNGGGVYLLRDESTQALVIMKEGRANAGWDPRGMDAFSRVRYEYSNLLVLSGTQLVPKPLDFRTLGDHAFLFEEFVDGLDMHSWVASRYPYSYTYDLDGYVEEALEVLGKLEVAVGEVHSSGFALMDLQPTNIIVSTSGDVRFIDLESCCAVSGDQARSRIGTPGFMPKGEHTPVGRDNYALLQLALNLFCPTTSLTALSDSVVDTQLTYIAKHFPDRVVSKLRALLGKAAAELTNSRLTSYRLASDGSLEIDSLLAGVTLGIERTRADESNSGDFSGLYPIGASASSKCSQLALEHGLAGLLFALDSEGRNSDDDVRVIAQAAAELRAPVPGLLDGMTGVSVFLSARGRHREAMDLYRRVRSKSRGKNNLSIRSGLAGELIGQIAIYTLNQAPEMLIEIEASVEELSGYVARPPAAIVSPGRMSAIPLGLIDGWSGVALSLTMAAKALGANDLYDVAREAIELDFKNMVLAPDGSLQANDGFRMMPYLADGSGGLGLALALIPIAHRRSGDDRTLARVLQACQARVSISGGLFHGRAGLLLCIAVIGALRFETSQGVAGFSEQFSLLSLHLFTWIGEAGVYLSADDNRRLSLDLASGSAGLAFLIRIMKQSPDDDISRWLKAMLVP